MLVLRSPRTGTQEVLSLTVSKGGQIVGPPTDARRAVKKAFLQNYVDGVSHTCTCVNTAKMLIGVRRPLWWPDGSKDFNRYLVRNRPCAKWCQSLEAPEQHKNRKVGGSVHASFAANLKKFDQAAGQSSTSDSQRVRGSDQFGIKCPFQKLVCWVCGGRRGQRDQFVQAPVSRTNEPCTQKTLLLKLKRTQHKAMSYADK